MKAVDATLADVKLDLRQVRELQLGREIPRHFTRETAAQNRTVTNSYSVGGTQLG